LECAIDIAQKIEDYGLKLGGDVVDRDLFVLC